jgi:hypothetical protein
MEPGSDLVNPLGLLTFGSLVFVDLTRSRNNKNKPGHVGEERIPAGYAFNANYIFVSEDHMFDRSESVEHFLRVPRILRVSKCRDPHRIMPYMVDPFEQYLNQPLGWPENQQIRLSFDDAVLLRFSFGEPDWRIERQRYANMRNLPK